jgi:phenylalanyl-tRNA synthetase beta chain
MKFSENWLREWVDPGVSRDELCHRLDMIGLEVESVVSIGDGLDGVIVGEIVDAQPHPDAERLQVCRVATGHGEPLQIVCGAPNARVGLKAPLATIGASLPNGMQIKAAKLRGVESNGMLCSAKELGLDADASGLLELPADAPVGESLTTYLGLPDAVIELGLTPNRADCLGMRGLASDVAAAFGSSVREPAIVEVAAATAAKRTIRLEAGAVAPVYAGRVIEGIDTKAQTPSWMCERLRRASIRPISAVVDVTAYVMLELGQPMHAFDSDRLDGDIVVRHATDGETLKLLDGREVTVDSGFLVIADANAAQALAGVMGGFDSRVTDETGNVFLEAAHFAPSAVIGRARRLGMHTDASHRFERGVDPALPRLAIERATTLLLEIVGGQAGPVIEATIPSALPVRPAVKLRRDRIVRLLGIEIPDAEVECILTTLDMRVEATADGWQATPPSRRFDIAIEEDLIEEIARIHGYDRVPEKAPGGDLAPRLPSETRLPDGLIRRTLAARGWQEALTFAFLDPSILTAWKLDEDVVALANPLSAELGAMRTSLLPGLVQALVYNRARQQERVRLFELGRTFRARGNDEAPLETDCIALVACGPAHSEQWSERSRPVDFHDLKGDVEALLALGGDVSRYAFEPAPEVPWLHPGRAAAIRAEGRVIGYIGIIHPLIINKLNIDFDVMLAEIELNALRQARVPAAEGVSKFPQIRRDIAVIVTENTPFGSLSASIRKAVGEDLEAVTVFDEYRGPGLSDGVKSVAMGLILRNTSRTLTDSDADVAVSKAVQALRDEYGAELRG